MSTTNSTAHDDERTCETLQVSPTVRCEHKTLGDGVVTLVVQYEAATTAQDFNPLQTSRVHEVYNSHSTYFKWEAQKVSSEGIELRTFS